MMQITKPIVLVMSVHEQTLVSTAKKIAADDCLVIYPEAGLHPSRHMQKVEAIIDRAVTSSSRLVIMTHSEGIVNGIGNRIEAKRWPVDAFALVVVGKDETLRMASYDANGALGENWPFGFFAPCEDTEYDGVGWKGEGEELHDNKIEHR